MKVNIVVNGRAAAIAAMRKQILKEEADLAEKEIERLKQNLAAATPVDSGEARSRWKVKSIFGKAYVVYNDSPYIGKLNQGSSSQAPARFIEKVVLASAVTRPVGIIVNSS